MNFQSKVYLIGAGPGDPDLITIKGADILRRADIILYDALVNKDILKIARPNCEIIFVGKRMGKHSLSQNEINTLLLDSSKINKIIVRLKGGDPLIFGRGGEEIEFLRKNNIEIEVVPGVTTSSAAAAKLQFPLTHRRYGQGVLFLSGYSKENSNSDGLPDYDWDFLAKSSLTMVFYMGLQNLERIADKLISGGKTGDTECVVISNCSLPEEKSLSFKLSEISGISDNHEIDFPALFIVGDVLKLKNTTRAFHKKHDVQNNDDEAILILFHGSKKSSGEPEEFVQNLMAKSNKRTFYYAYISEGSSPDYKEVTRQIALNDKLKTLHIWPIFLLPGKHLKQDIPLIADEIQREHPHFKVKLHPSPGINYDLLPALSSIAMGLQ